MKKKDNLIRNIILSISLILFTIFSLKHFILPQVSPSIDALCPFGGFETLITLITSKSFIPQITISSLILAIGVVLTVIFFRRGFCGYICPFGALQEFLKKITKIKYEIPLKIHNKLIYLKYVILLIILLGTYYFSYLVFRNYDPFLTFFHFGKGIFWNYSPTEFIILLIPFIITITILLLSIFIERFWCIYLCPLGALTALISKFSFTKIKRNHSSCISCKLCDKKCPAKINISTKEHISSIECINCNRCVNNCPKNSLSIQLFNKEISPKVYTLGLLTLFISIIVLSQIFGIWQSIPTLKESSNKVEIAESIKGWMTLNDVSNASKIPLNIIIKDLNLPQNINTSLQMRYIASKYNIVFETSNVRDYLVNYDSLHNKSISNSDFNINTNTNSNTDPLNNNINNNKPQPLDNSCPWGIQDDPSPGKCGLYKDTNKNGLCDYS